MNERAAGRSGVVSQTLKQIAIGAAGSFVTILFVTLWGWISEEGLVRGLGGASVAQLAEVRSAVENLPTNLAKVILLTDEECKVFGQGWERYEELDGRFPLGAGTNKDARDEERTFSLDDPAGGEYSHQLTVPEMPSHDHRLSLYPYHHNKADHGDDRTTHHGHRETVTTSESGGVNQPHNNMPPYRVMNFCYKGQS